MLRAIQEQVGGTDFGRVARCCCTPIKDRFECGGALESLIAAESEPQRSKTFHETPGSRP